jgi:GDPmannose 4,6-dehydratase
MYGDNPEVPQRENTRMTPASPYACAKLFSHNLVRNYRAGYGMHASSGILFNHESPMRGETFVTRKITMAAANIKLGRQSTLELGNMDAKRDWGFAGDYVEAMWMMIQQDQPDDYVIATGITTYVRDFVRMSFDEVGITLEFNGEGVEEVGYVKSCSNPDYQLEIGKAVVAVDPKYFRPTEVELLIGDPTKSKTKLGWEPKYDLKALVKDMMMNDLELFKRDKYLQKGGHKIMNYYEL